MAESLCIYYILNAFEMLQMHMRHRKHLQHHKCVAQILANSDYF